MRAQQYRSRFKNEVLWRSVDGLRPYLFAAVQVAVVTLLAYLVMEMMVFGTNYVVGPRRVNVDDPKQQEQIHNSFDRERLPEQPPDVGTALRDLYTSKTVTTFSEPEVNQDMQQAPEVTRDVEQEPEVAEDAGEEPADAEDAGREPVVTENAEVNPEVTEDVLPHAEQERSEPEVHQDVEQTRNDDTLGDSSEEVEASSASAVAVPAPSSVAAAGKRVEDFKPDFKVPKAQAQRGAHFIDPLKCTAELPTRRAFVVVAVKGFNAKYLHDHGRSWVQLLGKQHPETDIIIMVPGDLVKEDHKAAIRDFVAQWSAKGYRLQMREFATFLQKERFAPGHLYKMEQHQNCCGWKEMLVLAVWGLEEYEAVVYIELDIAVLRPLPELFACAASGWHFLSSSGVWSPINGGLMVIKPSKAILDEMTRVLQDGQLEYSHKAGYNGAGNPKPWKPGEIRGFGSETIQGFVGWFFHKHLPSVHGEGDRPWVGRIDMCKYNYQVVMKSGGPEEWCPHLSRGGMLAQGSSSQPSAVHKIDDPIAPSTRSRILSVLAST